MTYRIGYGEDSHRLEPGRPLVIGNLPIEGSLHGAVAHSDGDVLLHALADALLSALALGDIGDYFPPSDARFKNMDSAEILGGVLTALREAHQDIEIINVALVVTLDRPKLGPQRSQIQSRVAALLGLVPEQVGLGFKTSEGLAPGHVQARATVLLSCS